MAELDEIIRKLDEGLYSKNKSLSRLEYGTKLMNVAQKLESYSEKELVFKVSRHYELDIRFTVKFKKIEDWTSLMSLLAQKDDEDNMKKKLTMTSENPVVKNNCYSMLQNAEKVDNKHARFNLVSFKNRSLVDSENDISNLKKEDTAKPSKNFSEEGDSENLKKLKLFTKKSLNDVYERYCEKVNKQDLTQEYEILRKKVSLLKSKNDFKNSIEDSNLKIPQKQTKDSDNGNLINIEFDKSKFDNCRSDLALKYEEIERRQLPNLQVEVHEVSDSLKSGKIIENTLKDRKVCVNSDIKENHLVQMSRDFVIFESGLSHAKSVQLKKESFKKLFKQKFIFKKKENQMYQHDFRYIKTKSDKFTRSRNYNGIGPFERTRFNDKKSRGMRSFAYAFEKSLLSMRSFTEVNRLCRSKNKLLSYEMYLKRRRRR